MGSIFLKMKTNQIYYNNFRPVDHSKCFEYAAIPFLYVIDKNIYYKVNKSGKEVLIRLKSKSIRESIGEIEKRKLHKSDSTRAPRQKIEKMKLWHSAVVKLKDCVELFSWPPYKNLKYINSSSAVSLEFSFNNKNSVQNNLSFNSTWVLQSEDEEIISKLREFVLHYSRS